VLRRPARTRLRRAAACLQQAGFFRGIHRDIAAPPLSTNTPKITIIYQSVVDK